MRPPHGPHRIAKNGQVVIPREILHAASLEAGDAVYFQVNDELAGSILVVPMEVATRWFELGQRAERAEEPESRT